MTAIWGRGDAYERYVGRWSRLVARQFVAWLALPPHLDWLDAGTGTGALAGRIRADAAPRSVTGVDPAAGFVAEARRAVDARFALGDAAALPLRDGSFDVAVAGLVLNFVRPPERAISELARVVRSGGTVAAYVWDYAGEMQLMRRFWDAAIALDPAVVELDEGRRSPICAPGPLRDAFAQAGSREVEVRAIDVPTVFEDFDAYWTPFLGGQGPAPAYTVALDEPRRTALRERLLASLPAGPDGRIELIARAWAVRATRP